MYCQTNTHYTTHLVAANSNTATTNGIAVNNSVFLNVIDNSTVNNAINIKGTGATAVTSSNGIITINSTDNNNATAQNISTTNSTYPILLGNTPNATANIGNKATWFGSSVKVNPNTSTVYANRFISNLRSASNITISTSTGNAAGKWYAENNTINGKQYTQRYRYDISNLTANDIVEIEITGNGHKARAAGMAPFVQSFAGYIYLYATAVPTSTFTIKYHVASAY